MIKLLRAILGFWLALLWVSFTFANQSPTALQISTNTSTYSKNLNGSSTNQQIVDNVVDQLNTITPSPRLCNAGNFPLGIDNSGNAVGCTPVTAGGVASVTASSPLSSSGGSTPNITFTNPGYITGISWGGITGTLSNQTDLQTEFNTKQNTITTGTTLQYLRGDLSLATFPTNLNQFTNGPGYITGNQNITLSGDISGSGTTSIVTTLPMVNGNVGTFQGIAVNAKGQVTGATNQNYLTGNQTITASGDATGSGTTSLPLTLTTVNSNVGTFQGITVNGKGLVIAASNQNYLTTDLWTASGSNVYRPSGNVGVGSVNPGQKLDVSGTVRATNLLVGTQPVCQANGTNCPPGASLWATSGGSTYNTVSGTVSINLGAGSGVDPFQVNDSNDGIGFAVTIGDPNGYGDYVHTEFNVLDDGQGDFFTRGVEDNMATTGDTQVGDYGQNYSGCFLDINSNNAVQEFYNCPLYSTLGYFIDIGNLGGVIGGILPDYNGLPIMDAGMNFAQAGSIDSTHMGVYFRWDIRGPSEGGPLPLWQLSTEPINDGNPADQLTVIRMTNVNSSTPKMADIIIGFPDNGTNNTGTGNDEHLQVYGNTYLGGNVGINTSQPTNAALLVMGGNVGIGTLRPGDALDVTGAVRSTLGFAVGGNVGITTTCPASSNWNIVKGLVVGCH